MSARTGSDSDKSVMSASAIKHWYVSGWRLFARHWPRYILLSCLAFLIADMAGAFVYLVTRSEWQFIAYCISMLVLTPFFYSFYVIFLGQTESDRPPRLRDLFSGFAYFIPANIAQFTVLVLTVMGMALLVFPGLFVSALSMFILPVMARQKAGVWAALRSSWKLTLQHWPLFLAFGTLNLLIMLLGAVTIVGSFVVLPWLTASITTAYRQVLQGSPSGGIG